MQARQGIKVGKCMLFFGARYKQDRWVRKSAEECFLDTRHVPMKSGPF